MSQDDRFSEYGDQGKTMVRPSPGGRRRQAPNAEPVVVRKSRSSEPNRQSRIEPVSTSNQMTANALSLLMLVPKLRKVAFHSSVNDLQERLVAEIGTFQNRSIQQGYSEEEVRTASYLICSLIDETILNTPWGSESFWGHDTLLVKFHREAVGGEEFFPMVDRLMRRPTEHLDLLEFAYMCLSLGFEGKYRLAPDGLHVLEDLRTEIYTEIQRLRGDLGLSLSVNWQGMRDLRNPFTRYVPLWVLAAVSCLILVLVYIGYLYAINIASDRIAYGDTKVIASEELKIPEPQPPVTIIKPAEPQTPLPDFGDLLADEIGKKLVVLAPGPILRLTAAFDSGKDQVRTEYMPLLHKVGQALKDGTSRIEVTGHTDDKPIRSVRFPSNWHLSVARAKAVEEILDSYGPFGDRISFEGKADRHPIADNKTNEGRAINRRIDIYIR